MIAIPEPTIPEWAHWVRFPRPSNRVPFTQPGTDFTYELDVKGYCDLTVDRSGGWFCLTCQARFLVATDAFVDHIDRHRLAGRVPLVAHLSFNGDLAIPLGWLDVLGWPPIEACAFPSDPGLVVEIVDRIGDEVIVSPLVGGGLVRLDVDALGPPLGPGESWSLDTYARLMRNQSWPLVDPDRRTPVENPAVVDRSGRTLVAVYGHDLRYLAWADPATGTHRHLDGAQFDPRGRRIDEPTQVERAIMQRLLATEPYLPGG